MTAGPSIDRDILMRRIKRLSELLWENRCAGPEVEAWLKNFDGRHGGSMEQEHLHALHLLSSVSFFGLREIRVLLRAMYRDHFRYPIIQDLRQTLNTRDGAILDQAFRKELDLTRFAAVGNPAESGTHLLYYFRQENGLARNGSVGVVVEK